MVAAMVNRSTKTCHLVVRKARSYNYDPECDLYFNLLGIASITMIGVYY